ncbi:hypothetical protein [Bradyrhizobium sp. 613_E4_N2_2]|uniref:hypothetical protein n=1 Tax=Bradyrhizobium sp. 613_E4_N2_2 TaxID=3240371 RepID=UPI003F8A5D9A
MSIKDAWLRHEPALLAGLLFVSGVVLGVIGGGIQHREDVAQVVMAYGEASKGKDALIHEQGQRLIWMSERLSQLAGKVDKTATKAATAAKDAKEAVDNIPQPEPKKKHWWSK